MWYDPIIEFSARFLVATIIFILLAAVAVFLSFVVGWLEASGLDDPIVYIFRGLEYVVVIIDVVVYVVFVGGSAIRAIRTMLQR